MQQFVCTYYLGLWQGITSNYQLFFSIFVKKHKSGVLETYLSAHQKKTRWLNLISILFWYIIFVIILYYICGYGTVTSEIELLDQLDYSGDRQNLTSADVRFWRLYHY